MRTTTLAALVLVLALGTPGCSRKKRDSDRGVLVTPAGYRVAWYEKGSTTSTPSRFTLAEALSMFDQAVERGIKEYVAKYGWNESVLREMARGTVYDLHDDRRFQAPTTGQWVTGAQLGGWIGVAIYERRDAKTRAEVPPEAPPWTIEQQPDTTWRYGILNPERPVPAVGHELGHKYTRDPNFEH